MSDKNLKQMYGKLLKDFVKYCNENNYMPGTPEFEEASNERLLLPFMLLCNGDREKTKRLIREYATEHGYPIDPRFR